MVIPIFVAIVGVTVPLLASSFGDDPEPTPPDPNAESHKEDVPRFSGVAGNLEEARALLTFLEDHDGGVVRLDEVGFPDVRTGEYIVENEVDAGGRTVQRVTYVQIWTECEDGLQEGESPAFANNCTATSIEIDGDPSEDSQGYLTHGVPVYDGFFRVDVSGTLHMGVTPIFLEPVDREDATG